MPPGRGADILIVSLGSTAGLRAADEELAAAIERAGARAEVASAEPPRRARTFALTDVAWALAARRAAARALARSRPASIIYSSTTAALLSTAPGAIRFDASARGNRPGRHGVWQRRLERRRLAHAPLLLPWSRAALDEAAPSPPAWERTIVLPVPVEPSAPTSRDGRDVAAVTHGGNPHKKGLDVILGAWEALLAAGGPPGGGDLVIAGTSEDDLARAGIAIAGRPGVRLAGMLDPGAYRALLRRARVYVCAARREDYGIAQLEALADGCQLVTTPSPGPYVALGLARDLDPRLVGDDLAGALRTALAEPLPGYAERAAAALEPFRRATSDRIVAEELLPRLFTQGAQLG
jgi:Glycosyl transferases group 1